MVDLDSALSSKRNERLARMALIERRFTDLLPTLPKNLPSEPMQWLRELVEHDEFGEAFENLIAVILERGTPPRLPSATISNGSLLQ